jgi:hypothetical protein
MVCSFENLKRLNLKQRSFLLGVEWERAKFLASCSHTDVENPQQSIPHEPLNQLKEAIRMGIGLRDTALMMGMKQTELKALGLPFKTKSTMPKPSGRGGYNLMSPVVNDPIKCNR